MIRAILGSALLAVGATAIVFSFGGSGPISTASVLGVVLLLGGTHFVRYGLRTIQRAEEPQRRRR
jgi:hypothetical protein